MIRLKTIIIFVFISSFLMGQGIDSTSSKLDFDIHFNIQYCDMKPFKASTIDPAVRPGIGSSIWYHFNPKFSGRFFMGFNVRSAMDTNKLRFQENYFLEGGLNFSYEIGKGLYAEAGARYNYFITNSYRAPGDFYPEYSVFKPYESYDPTIDLTVGLRIDFIDRVDIGVKTNFPSYLAKMNKDPFLDVQFSLIYTLEKKDPFEEKYGYFQYEKITNIDDALRYPEYAEKLVLHRQNIDELTADIGKLYNLKILYLDGNNLTELPEEIGQLKELRFLSVRHNKLTKLPESISDLENLQEIHLDGNNLKELPASITKLKNLKFLYIGKNSMEVLPDDLGNLTSLVEFSVIRSGPLLQLPSSLFEITTLERIYIDETITMPYTKTQANPRLQIIQVNR
jgi:hypothetical protein